MKKKEEGELFFEEVTERIGNHVLASKLHNPSFKEIREAKRLHLKGECPHTIVRDTQAYMYDFRTCAICGKGLGTV